MYLLGVSTVCNSEHSHETLWGVTGYIAPEVQTVGHRIGFWFENVFRRTFVDYYGLLLKIKVFPYSFRDSETSTNITVTF